MLLVEQLAHQRFVLPGPLVLRKRLRKFLRPQWVGDQPVLRYFNSLVTKCVDYTIIHLRFR